MKNKRTDTQKENEKGDKRNEEEEVMEEEEEKKEQIKINWDGLLLTFHI